jgi:hypothetical protein
MVSFSLTASSILFLASGISAQPGTSLFFPNLHFGLLECSNYLEQYGWPDVNHEGAAGEATWNLVGMFPEGQPRAGWPNPNSTWLYQLPQDGFPYKKYEGWNSSTFFWADPDQLKNYPRGWLQIHIPASAKGMKTEIQAGTITFEGTEFQCARQNMALFLGGGSECRATNREFCAGYTYCQMRYMCRREVWPADKNCVGSQANFCYPQWDNPNS